MVQRTRFTTIQNRKGAAAVELAIVLPFVIFMLLVSTDFARVFYYSMTVTNCARNGAIYACDPVTASQSPFRTVEEAALADASNLSPSATVSSKTVSTYFSSYVEVTVNYTFETITNYPGIPSKIALSRTVRMRSVAQVPNFSSWDN